MSIFEGFLSTPEVLEAFSERQVLQAMLDFEAALARAQAAAGLIPDAAARSIIGTCKIELFDVSRVVRESGRAGDMAIPLVGSLKETVGLFNKEAAAYVHLGASSQDVIDTALALVTRTALELVESDVHKAVAALLLLADRHAADPVLARTLMQPASVTSFGLKCTVWAAPLVRCLQRLQGSAGQALSLQLGGAVGTLAQMKGQGPRVLALMAADLGLRAPSSSWHAQRDEWVALGCELGLLAGSLGKIARDIALMGQYELGEVFEPAARPQQRHPVGCMVALAASVRAPQRVAALLAAMPQEHERALGNWQAELAEWPGLLMSVHGSARAMAQALPGLQVDTQRMRANLDALRADLPAGLDRECFDPALAQQAAALTRTQITLQTAALMALGSRREFLPSLAPAVQAG
jgi:3-carboxy-cis,cis-muconate cycloisomerase